MTALTELRRCPVDLHLHTRRSDGDDEPEQVAAACVAAGVRIAAVADHDTMGGVAGFRAAAGEECEVLAGCEITASWRGAEVHCLGLLVAEGDALFNARLARVRDGEQGWWREWTHRAQRIGVPLEWAEVERQLGAGRVAYSGDYVQMFLAAAGDDLRFRQYGDDAERELVEHWCKPGQPLHLPEPWRPELTEAIAWIIQAGGVPVLAHPARLLAGLGQAAPIELQRMRDAGLAGLEVWTTWHTPEESVHLAGLCEELDLVATLGSDYHGTRLKPWAPGPGLLPALPPDPVALVDTLRGRAGGATSGGVPRS